MLAGPAGADPFGSRLERWVADARVDEAAVSRHRTRHLIAAAALEATVLGLLTDLAERGAPVVLEAAGDRHTGWISTVGVDFVAITAAAGPSAVLSTAALDLIRPASGGSALGARPTETSLTLLRVLEEMAEDRERIRVRTRSGASVSGVLLSVGRDVLRLRADADSATAAFVPLGSVASIALP